MFQFPIQFKENTKDGDFAKISKHALREILTTKAPEGIHIRKQKCILRIG